MPVSTIYMHMSKTSEDRHEQARLSYSKFLWDDSFSLYKELDDRGDLDRGDLENYARSAALSGHDLEMLSILERLFQNYVGCGEEEEAARSAFWIGFRLVSIGELGQANAWFQRSRKLVANLGRPSVLEGYLLLPEIHRLRAEGNVVAAAGLAEQVIVTGNRFEDRDLAAFAQNLLGDLYIRSGRVAEGLALLDEAMLSVSSGQLSPLITGLVYCSVIATCSKIQALDRAREWTAALSAWCASQPQLYTFIGRCMVHRSEISQLHGEWTMAEDEARNAFRQLVKSVDKDSAAAAKYQEGEIYRLRGEYGRAKECYLKASEYGMEPLPGYALLRHAQGNGDLAVNTIRRALDSQREPFGRIRLLPAFVEIMLENDHYEEAAYGSEELTKFAVEYGTEVLSALASQAHGQVLLAQANPREAIQHLRSALSIWQKLEAPYIVCRIRLLLATACLELGDRDGAALELEPAKICFSRIGAKPDLLRLQQLGLENRSVHGLTRRETQVLRLMVAGETNREIATELGLSPKTIDRHVSNIFNKLGVSSRTEAAAFAIRKKIV
jgi:DNA-binding NarL/FixJ family response regulator